MSNLEKENQSGINRGAPHANNPLQYLTATSMIANKVNNKLGERLGDIKDIMIDVNTGKIEYFIIEFGGFLGIGEKFFAIPFRLLRIDTVDEVFILDQQKEILEKAPGFDKDHWPKTNSHEFDGSNSYWGSFMGPNTGGH